MKSRDQYLAGSLSRTEPWKAFGIKRRAWERRGKPTPPPHDAGLTPSILLLTCQVSDLRRHPSKAAGAPGRAKNLRFAQAPHLLTGGGRMQAKGWPHEFLRAPRRQHRRRRQQPRHFGLRCRAPAPPCSGDARGASSRASRGPACQARCRDPERLRRYYPPRRIEWLQSIMAFLKDIARFRDHGGWNKIRNLSDRDQLFVTILRCDLKVPGVRRVQQILAAARIPPVGCRGRCVGAPGRPALAEFWSNLDRNSISPRRAAMRRSTSARTSDGVLGAASS